MFNLVVLKGTLGQKALTVAKYLQKTYPNNFKISHTLTKDCQRNIILSQKPIPYEKKSLKEYINAIKYRRPNFIHSCALNYATNGFSVFSENVNYMFFIPRLYDYKNKIKIQNIKNFNIGYYYTTYRNTEKYFLEFIKNNKTKLNFITILNYNNLHDKLLSINSNFNIETTLDKDYFFSKITHLITPMSKTFIDPWPTVLEEGVRCNKQLIILKINRNWNDGIDDICSCVKYHENINETMYDNSQCSINNFNLDMYYKHLIQFNFEYTITRYKYKDFNSFLENFHI